jgi:hypothetical protein
MIKCLFEVMGKYWIITKIWGGISCFTLTSFFLFILFCHSRKKDHLEEAAKLKTAFQLSQGVSYGSVSFFAAGSCSFAPASQSRTASPLKTSLTLYGS